MQDGAFVLHLKMVHTPLKVPDDHVRMQAHSFSFPRRRSILKIWSFKEELRGASYPEQLQEAIKKCSELNSAPRVRKM